MTADIKQHADLKQHNDPSVEKESTAKLSPASLAFVGFVSLVFFLVMRMQSAFLVGFPVGILAMICFFGQTSLGAKVCGSILGGGLGFSTSVALSLVFRDGPTHSLLGPYAAVILFGLVGLVGGAIVAAAFFVHDVITRSPDATASKLNRDDHIVFIVGMMTLIFAFIITGGGAR